MVHRPGSGAQASRRPTRGSIRRARDGRAGWIPPGGSGRRWGDRKRGERQVPAYRVDDEAGLIRFALRRGWVVGGTAPRATVDNVPAVAYWSGGEDDVDRIMDTFEDL